MSNSNSQKGNLPPNRVEHQKNTYLKPPPEISYNLLALSTSAFHINPPFHGGIRLNVRRNPWVLKAPLPVGDFNAAVGNQTWLKNWPFGRLLSAVSTCIQEHQCHTIILGRSDIGALNYCLEAQGRLAVTTTQTFYIGMYCTSQIRVTLLAGSVTTHTGKRSLRGLKQTFLNQHGTGGWISWPHSDSAAEYFKMFIYSPGNYLTYPTWGKGKPSSKVPGWGYVSFQGHKAFIRTGGQFFKTSWNFAPLCGHIRTFSTCEKWEIHFMTSSGCKLTASVSTTHGDVHQFLRRWRVAHSRHRGSSG